MHPMLNTAIKAARRAGTIINRASLDLERLQVGRKGPNDYVTEVDQAAEEAIIDVLRTAYPDHGFLCEESGEHLAGSEEHTSELQSRENLVCRLLLEKKKKTKVHETHYMRKTELNR